MRANEKRWGILLLILFLVGFLIYASWPFFNAFFGALILFVLFRPLYNLFLKKNLGKRFSAVLIVLISLFLVIVPLLIMIALVGFQVLSFFSNMDISAFLGSVQSLFPNINIGTLLRAQIPVIGNFFSGLFLDIIQSVSVFFIGLTISMFCLYYLLVSDNLAKKLVPYLPFSEKNFNKLLKEFDNISRSAIFVTGLIAIFQGFLLWISFIIFGVEGALFWGVLAVFLSFLPVIGPPIIWIPISILKAFNGDWFSSIGILVFGLLLSNGDNLIRPYLQEKVGKIHPLVSLIGVFIGIPLFGLMGVVVGPLLISYSLIIIKIYQEEHGSP